MDGVAADEEAQTHTALIAPADRQPLSMHGNAAGVQTLPQRLHLLYGLHAVTLLLLLVMLVMLLGRSSSQAQSGGVLAIADPAQPAALAVSAALPVRLPSPLPSFGRYLLFTGFGRESNRYLVMIRAAQYALFTDRRLVLAPYDTHHSTPLSFMYNIDEMDKQMREARAVLGRPALEMDQSLAHVLSWAEYQQLALGLSASSIEARTPVAPDARHPGHCFALERVVCTRDCFTAVHDQCVEGLCPLDTRRPFSVVPLPDTLSALRASTDADPLLVITGDTVWYTPIWKLLNTSEPDQRVSVQHKDAIEGMGPSLHPLIMQRAHAILEDIRANQTAHYNRSVHATETTRVPSSSPAVAVAVAVPVPVLVLHIRLGDFVSEHHRASPLATRLSGMLAAASSMGLTDLNRTTTSTCVVIVTDSTSEEEKAIMRRTFPSAIIGLAESQREADRIALAFAARSQLSPHETRVLFPVTPPVFNVLLDKALCIIADYFIGTKGSTFSGVITRLRLRRGHKHTTQAAVE